MILVPSAAYVDLELAAEFGRLPPSFMPVGHRRLYEYQLDELAAFNDNIYLTVPESFEIPCWDVRRLRERGVSVLAIPDGLRLGESITHALNLIGYASGPLRILHGDTLIYGLPVEEVDVVSVHTVDGNYPWAGIASHRAAGDRTGPFLVETGNLIATGYFAFSNIEAFIRALARARGDFIGAINLYDGVVGLRAMQRDRWLDFGHLQTFYGSRRSVSIARSFNSLQMTEKSVEKISSKSEKVGAEAAWFESIPPDMRVYCPTYLGRRSRDGRDGYALEYLYCPTLHELFVFGALGETTWRRILHSCMEFLSNCVEHRPVSASTGTLDALVVDKTMRRLHDYAAASGQPLEEGWRINGSAVPSLLRIAEDTGRLVTAAASVPQTVMHGDFCFTNIFYEFRQKRVKVIDPRGSIHAGQPTIMGDVRYDLAKFNHSIEGLYDYILAGRYHLTTNAANDVTLEFPTDGAGQWLTGIAGEFSVLGHGISSLTVRAMSIHLFLSMLPLHADRPDRQLAFVANALRLFKTLDS